MIPVEVSALANALTELLEELGEPQQSHTYYINKAYAIKDKLASQNCSLVYHDPEALPPNDPDR